MVVLGVVGFVFVGGGFGVGGVVGVVCVVDVMIL